MYSKLKLLGHPLHPMLVAFPIALYTAAFVAYAVYAWQGDPFWFQVAFTANVAGVVTALVTAVPGFVDWAFGIPNGHSAKKVGTLHMSLNLAALALFAVNALTLWEQWGAAAPDSKWALVLSGLGVLATVGAGYFGYELIQRHHVGVDLTPEQQRFEPATPEAVRGEREYRRA
jgi:uncharacterized membrane protein